MIRNLIVRLAIPLAVALSALGGWGVAEAHAGCLATADSIGAAQGTAVGTARVNCTTNNGAVYQLRLYIQTNESGTYKIATPARTFQIVKPPANYGHLFAASWPCTDIPFGATRWRLKAVEENAVTNSVSVDVSATAAIPPGC